MPPALLSSTSDLLFNIAGAASAFPLALGLIGLVTPANGFKLFGFGQPSTPEAKKLGTNLLMFWVSRDLYMGVGALAAWYLNERKALGAMYVAGCGVALSDGIMSRRQIGKDAWKHMMWIPVTFTIGGGLLGWFE